MSAFSAKFEPILELLEDTRTTLIKWHDQFEKAKTPMLPSSVVPFQEILDQRQRAVVMQRHLELYGSRKITNLVEKWMQGMIATLDIYLSAYPKTITTSASVFKIPMSKARSIAEGSAKELNNLDKLQKLLTYEIRRFLLAQITPRIVQKFFRFLSERLKNMNQQKVN